MIVVVNDGDVPVTVVMNARTYLLTVPLPLIRSEVVPVAVVKLPNVAHVELLVEC